MNTLYERLGGEAAINLAVDKFYQKVLADERINHFFANLDMKQQIKHQKAFMTYAFGGGNNWNGRSMRQAHQKLVEEKGLTDIHFDAVAEDLVATLVELKIPQELIDEVVQIVGSVSHRNDVLNR
ncbi:globin [Rippkaea orientalis PCC 8801]|uniref:Group 1 truncated hemoglobin n=1 Tax=Rippkaea orientalis (strain PCC 8801 / RF-1) TaxID=41431 RepID=B7K1Y4_RIPO1|nr:group 1 truncated hemoglobin [Rippkaea orientalis]ACK64291.1 globin [Rippkaea orientalis PCC 8801]